MQDYSALFQGEASVGSSSGLDAGWESVASLGYGLAPRWEIAEPRVLCLDAAVVPGERICEFCGGAGEPILGGLDGAPR